MKKLAKLIQLEINWNEPKSEKPPPHKGAVSDYVYDVGVFDSVEDTFLLERNKSVACP